MRVAVVSSLIAVLGCGGSAKPAESPSSAETPSEPSTSSSSSADIPAAADSASVAESPPKAAAAASGAPAAAADAPATKGALHPVPTVTGSIDGQPFVPKLARVMGKIHKDGRILLSLSERTECGASNDARAGEATLTMMVPWKDGYKADLGSLRRSSKKAAGEISFTRVNAAKKGEISTKFKPSGTVTIVSAPMEQNAIGKMKIDLTSGDYMLAGDIDIQVCVSPK
jgi:pyruvate/2-oxoglutarate dehydrogenase complex dihydrolipoamide acyltransferase (E2) component